MSRYTFSTPSLEGSFSMSSYSTFSVSSFPEKDEMENDEHDLTSADKNLRHQNENTVVDSEKGLNVSLFIDVTKANQINKRKLMLCARFSNHYLVKLVDFSLIKLCVTEVTQSKLANRMAPTSVILRTP